MFNYNINWQIIIKLLTPPVYRTSLHLDWLSAIFKPLRTLYSQFIAYKDDKMYFASITFQKIAIEKMLNDLFDNEHRRIYLADTVKLTAIYVANKNKGYPDLDVYGKNVIHDPLYIYSRSSYQSQYDFIVYVPAMLYGTLDLVKMRSYIDDYKFGSKRYTIATY